MKLALNIPIIFLSDVSQLFDITRLYVTSFLNQCSLAPVFTL